MKEVTCILTSCGRFDLLRITLDSFLKYNTYDIAEFYAYEDSGIPVPKEIKDSYPFIKFVEPGKNTGQIKALDTLWQLVKTEYAFQMEDDWEFLKESFIERSIKILEYRRDVLMVWIKNPEQHNIHPIEWSGAYGIMKKMPNLWAWHRFNPSLKRKADYDLIGPFSKHTEWNPAKPWKCEADISKVYNNLGFTAAILPVNYIRHLGDSRHIG